MAFVSLAIIALVAFASPFIASAIPGKPVPETVFLLVLGAVLGPHMLGVIHVDAEVSLVSELGLAFLFLLAGFEIDPKSITGVEGRYGLATWVVTFGIAWLAVRFTPVVLSQSFRRYRRDACPHFDGARYACAHHA